MGEDHSSNLIEPEEARRIEALKADMRRPLSEKYPAVLAIIGFVALAGWGVTMWFLLR